MQPRRAYYTDTHNGLPTVVKVLSVFETRESGYYEVRAVIVYRDAYKVVNVYNLKDIGPEILTGAPST